MLFNPGASAFTFTIDNSYTFSLNFVGVVNNSGVTQNFVVSDGATLSFNAGAAAGSPTTFTTETPVG
jgi:hypothetical protein